MQRESLRNVAPLSAYLSISVSNTGATFCQYEALKYVSFPTQTLGKCGKTIPVLILGNLIGGTRGRDVSTRTHALTRSQSIDAQCVHLSHTHLLTERPNDESIDAALYNLSRQGIRLDRLRHRSLCDIRLHHVLADRCTYARSLARSVSCSLFSSTRCRARYNRISRGTKEPSPIRSLD